MKFNLEDFNAMLCRQMDNMKIFHGLWAHTLGNPCETGCGWFNGGACGGYKLLLQKQKGEKMLNPSVKTNQQIADELKACCDRRYSDITKRQVSKLRKSGELAELMEKYGI